MCRTRSRWQREMISSASRPFCTVLTHLCATAFALGARWGRANHLHALGCEDVVEGGRELAVSIVDHEAHSTRRPS
jgi:hypothetical protein